MLYVQCIRSTTCRIEKCLAHVYVLYNTILDQKKIEVNGDRGSSVSSTGDWDLGLPTELYPPRPLCFPFTTWLPHRVSIKPKLLNYRLSYTRSCELRFWPSLFFSPQNPNYKLSSEMDCFERTVQIHTITHLACALKNLRIHTIMPFLGVYI